MLVPAFIGLGSNLSNPTQQILNAIERIKELKNCVFDVSSSLYKTPPMGPQDQPHYINAVVKINTSLNPYELLSALQTIENQQGRTRDTGKWGARTLDLDVLLYGDVVSTDPKLTLPHPGLHLRAFVLYPLLEIDKQLDIPTLGSIQYLVEGLNETPPPTLS